MNGTILDMDARELFRGEAPGEHFTVRTSDDQAAEIVHVIFPIVMWRDDDPIVALGTGFFVGTNGLFVTAKHVVDSVRHEGKSRAQLGLVQLSPGKKFYLRPVLFTASHPIADLAVGYAAPMKHRITGAPLLNQTLALTAQPPAINSDVFTYAYPKTQVKGDGPGMEKIECAPGYFPGKLLETYPTGRDRVLLPGPCFRTSIVIHGGASGGPVITVDGRVFAINSTGVDDETLSFVSCISTLFDLSVPSVIDPSGKVLQTSSFRRFCEQGFIAIR